MTWTTIRSGATAMPEKAFLQHLTDMLETGGVVTTANDNLLVEQSDTPAMSVKVNPGNAWLRKTTGSAYPVSSDANETVTIGANASGNPRKDAVVVYQDLSETPNSTASDVPKLVAVAGTPGASPSAPSDSDIATAIGSANPFTRLANVTVASGAGTIVDANIEDTRALIVFNNLATKTQVQTFTNKRITKRAQSVTSSATPTPDVDNYDVLKITALAAAAEIQEPTGTPTEGQTFILRIKDNGTARALTWDSIFRAIGITLPTTTVINKTLYIGMIYNSTDSKWDVVAVQQEF